MKISGFTSLILLASAARVWAAVYDQSDSHQGDGFYKSFNFQAITDPSNGRV